MIAYSLFFSILLTLPIEVPHVVVTLKPIHALVSGVMTDVGKPDLLLSGGESPHTYNMKPSQVRQIQQADLLIWVGGGMETFLQKSLSVLEEKKQLRLDKIEGLHLLKIRKGDSWDAHQHHHSARIEEIDSHIWLDPDNAQVIVNAVAQTLSQLDEPHATVYKRNATQLIERIKAFDQQLIQQLKPYQAKPFLVFHDAYHYFEQHYGLTAVGTVTLSSEHTSSAKRIYELRTQIKTQGIICVFSEPQFTPRLIATLLEDTLARHGELDPLGAPLEAGTDAYFKLLQNLADAFAECFLPKN